MKTRFVLFAIVSSFVCNGLTAQADKGDSLALVDLYNSTNGPNWNHNTRWLTRQPLSTWYGIIVKDNRVTTLQLNANRLKGVLPASLCHLTMLNTLSLTNNALSGSIPDSIGNLVNLGLEIGDRFDLYSNKLSGIIPASIGNLSHVSQMNFSNNQLSGPIPATLGGMTGMVDLNLSNNKLTGGIPAGIGNLRNLLYLRIINNQLNGSIPASIDSCAKLYFVDLSLNSLTDTIPDISNLRSLSYLYLQDNRLTGRLPLPRGMNHLQVIDVTRNLLSQATNEVYDKKWPVLILNMYTNRYTFNGLEYIAAKIPYAQYAPQAPIPVRKHGNYLAVSAGGTLSNNTYRWYAVGTTDPVTIPGDSTFRPAKSGQYYALVSNAIATDLILATDTIKFKVTQSAIHLSVSPNPARNLVSINGLDAGSDCGIAVTDASGYVWIKSMSRKQSSLKIDISRLRTGYYLVTVNDGLQVKTMRFMKE